MKSSNENPKKGSSSKEELVHFKCGTCDKWWSIGDAPANKKLWYCPWCGKYQEIVL